VTICGKVVVDRLGCPGAVLIPDETGDLKKGRRACIHHYGTSNVAVAICGDTDADTAVTIAERRFATLPRRDVRSPAATGETEPVAHRRHSLVDGRAGISAMCVAWPVPDPIGDFPAYVPYALVAEIIAGSPAAPLPRSLVEKRLALGAAGMLSFTGQLFEALDPTVLLLRVYLPGDGDFDKVLTEVIEVCWSTDISIRPDYPSITSPYPDRAEPVRAARRRALKLHPSRATNSTNQPCLMIDQPAQRSRTGYSTGTSAPPPRSPRPEAEPARVDWGDEE
jgi:Peptidase M16 inactive domain